MRILTFIILKLIFIIFTLYCILSNWIANITLDVLRLGHWACAQRVVNNDTLPDHLEHCVYTTVYLLKKKQDFVLLTQDIKWSSVSRHVRARCHYTWDGIFLRITTMSNSCISKAHHGWYTWAWQLTITSTHDVRRVVLTTVTSWQLSDFASRVSHIALFLVVVLHRLFSC